jgi:hypothetical protein
LGFGSDAFTDGRRFRILAAVEGHFASLGSLLSNQARRPKADERSADGELGASDRQWRLDRNAAGNNCYPRV